MGGPAPRAGRRADRERIEQLEAALAAIGEGSADALVLPTRNGPRVLPLGGAYRVLVGELDQGMALLDEHGAVWYANRAFEEMTGLPLPRIVRRPFRDFVTAESANACLAAIEAARRAPARGEVRIARASGGSLPVLLSLAPLPPPETGAIGVVVTDRTLVERQAAQIRESEARFEALVDAAEEGIAVTTGDGHVVKANAALARMLGYASVRDLLREGTAAAALRSARERASERGAAREGARPVECRIVRRDGTERWVSALVQVVAPANGRGGTRIHYFLRDVTAERAEREDLARLAAIVRSNTHAIYTMAPDGRVLTWNPAAADLFGVPSSAALGQRIESVVAFAKSPASIPSIASRLRREAPVDPVEVEFRRSDGTTRSAAVLHSGIRDASGALTGIAAIATETTGFSIGRAGSSELDRALRKAQSAARVGTWTADAATGEAQWSPEVRGILGAGESEAPPRLEALLDALSPGSRAEADAILRRAVERGRPFEIDVQLDERHGGRWLLVKGAPVRAGEGAETGLRGTLQDITQRKMAEARAEALSAMNEAIVASLPGMFAVMDTAGGLVRCNAFMLERLGYGLDELKASGLLGIVAPEARPAAEDALRRILGEGRGVLETTLVAKDGSHVDCLLTGRALDGAEPGIVAIALDVTTRKRAEDLLRRTERLRTLGTLVAGVAHEINNPLTYIVTSLELATAQLAVLARDEAIAPRLGKVPADLATVRRGIDRIAHIVRSLRLVARAAKETRSVEAVNPMVEAILPVARARVPASVAIEPSLESRASISCDAGEVSQVLLNLLLNAAEAMNGKEGAIRVSTRDEGADVVIDVADEGPGIPADVRARLFTPFFTTKPHGTGLGLSVSLAIVESHGGSLTCESSTARGTTFRARFPRADPLPADASA